VGPMAAAQPAMKLVGGTQLVEYYRWACAGRGRELSESPSQIERREYKFLVDRRTAAALRAAIQPFCRIDPFAATNPNRSYTVETLYLDTPGLTLFWGNDHEQLDRFKMRVRRYAKPNSPVYLEVKRRYNDVISKSRGRLGANQWTALLEDPGAPIPPDLASYDRKAVERFLAYSRSLHVQPVTLVRYEREPYVSTIDDYGRVTFDTHVRARVIDRLSFDDEDGGSWRALDGAVLQNTHESLVVLEMKFTNQVPLWMVNIARSIGLVRGAFSKYGTSIRAFYQPTDARVPRNVGGWR